MFSDEEYKLIELRGKTLNSLFNGNIAFEQRDYAVAKTHFEFALHYVKQILEINNGRIS